MNIQYQNLHRIFSKIDALNLKDINYFFNQNFATHRIETGRPFIINHWRMDQFSIDNEGPK